MRTLIDPDAPGARYLGLLGFEGIVEDAPDDPATASLAPDPIAQRLMRVVLPVMVKTMEHP